MRMLVESLLRFDFLAIVFTAFAAKCILIPQWTRGLVMQLACGVCYNCRSKLAKGDEKLLWVHVVVNTCS